MDFDIRYQTWGALSQNGNILEWVHLALGTAPRVYSVTDQIADLIQKGRLTAVRHYGIDPDTIVIPYKLADINWLIHHHSRLALALEGYLGELSCHYGQSKWLPSLVRLPLRRPELFSRDPIPRAKYIFTEEKGKLHI